MGLCFLNWGFVQFFPRQLFPNNLSLDNFFLRFPQDNFSLQFIELEIPEDFTKTEKGDLFLIFDSVVVKLTEGCLFLQQKIT